MKPVPSLFAEALARDYATAETGTHTEVRWWMASAMHTDQTIREELYAMYNAGFGGVELCQLADRMIDENIYGYGGAQWEHDVRLILDTALDLGMSVSLTSGAGWSTANVPGLDPDSQQANQCVVLLTEEIPAGSTRTGALPADDKLRPKAACIGAVAIRKAGERTYDPKTFIDLTAQIQNGCLNWTAPADGNYTLMVYYAQGTAQAASPAVEKSYTVNYFDRRGVEALKAYLEKNILGDPELNAKIRRGNVQYFMDSLEYHCGAGITSWSENFAEQFKAVKGYDILPYLFLAAGTESGKIWSWEENAELAGIYSLTDTAMTRRILNDIYDIQTRLYLEEFIIPFRKWLNQWGITLRAQISYGKNLEISQPIAAVDYPETENRNQKNQVDMYRLWTGGAHLQNKILSAETGGLTDSCYNYTYQRHLQEAYALYAAGCSRIIWHIWSALYGPTKEWPGYEGGMSAFYKFGTREPSYPDYPLFNDHLARIQKFLRRGKACVDLGMIYTKYGQRMAYTDAKDWMRTHQPMFFPSVNLQDNGYTYDYLNGDLLNTSEVTFDRTTGRLELAGYRALVLWQKDLPVSAAKRILALAEDGLPVILVEGAAADSSYQSDNPAVLADILTRLKRLPNVCTVSHADDVLTALTQLGIHPTIGFSDSNQQILTQTRRDGENLFLYAWNYCDGTLHKDSNAAHGKSITTELVTDGYFIPYTIDAWSGKVQQVSARYEGRRTYIPITIHHGDTALIALESSKTVPVSAVPAICELPPFEITDWELTVESWTPAREISTRTETILGVTTSEYAYLTDKKQIHVMLEHLTTWEQIPSVGETVSGIGIYRAAFSWNGDADGAYLDFGSFVQSIRVKINGTETDPVNINFPRVDISHLLRTGENTIEVEYRSNLNNIQFSRGKIPADVLPSNFLGYRTGYQQYGLKQAILHPYSYQ